MFDIKLIVGTRDKYSLPICNQKVFFCSWRTQKSVGDENRVTPWGRSYRAGICNKVTTFSRSNGFGIRNKVTTWMGSNGIGMAYMVTTTTFSNCNDTRYTDHNCPTIDGLCDCPAQRMLAILVIGIYNILEVIMSLFAAKDCDIKHLN